MDKEQFEKLMEKLDTVKMEIREMRKEIVYWLKQIA